MSTLEAELTGHELTVLTEQGIADAEELYAEMVAVYERLIRRLGRRAAESLRAVTAASDWQPPPDGSLFDEATPDVAALNAAHRKAVRKSARPALERLGISWEIAAPLTADLLEHTAQRTGERLGAAVQPVLREAVAEAYEQGLSVEEAAGVIRQRIEDAAPWQARMLARTDLNGLANGASVAAAKLAQAPMKVWLTATDERARETHVAANGQAVPVDQPFQVGGELLAFPGDPAGSDENVANCRCTVVYEERARPRVIREEGVVVMAAANEEALMPWHIENEHESCPASTPFAVVKDSDGKVAGCHPTEEKAKAQLRALYSVMASAGDLIGEAFRDGFDCGCEDEPVAVTAAAVAETRRGRTVAPLHPPRDWFLSSEFPGPTPLTVTKEGRVFGHVALWDTCHTGLGNQCVRPPRSNTNYAYFHVGEIETKEGDAVAVGKLMLGSKHAPLSASVHAAAQHYDDNGMVGAYVRAVDGEHGIWVSGALRHNLSDERLRDFRANPPSGDWRAVRGALELIAALAVPVPGFPVPRANANLVASGDTMEVTSLIASPGCIEPEGAVRDALVAAGLLLDDAACGRRAQVLAVRIEGGRDALAEMIGA